MTEPTTGEPVVPAPPVSVHVALARVIAEMPSIGKDERGPSNQGGYAYRGIEAITKHAGPLFGQHGIVIVPTVTVTSVQPSPAMKDGWQDTYITVVWEIVGPDGSTVTATTCGVGRDNVDKGINKAQTQAWKYLLLALLCVSDRADDADGQHYDDGRRPEQQPEPEHDDTWERLGWPSYDAFSAAHTAFQERTKGTSDAVRAEMREWRRGLEFGYPYTPDQMRLVTERLDAAIAAHTEPDRGAAAAQRAPEPAADGAGSADSSEPAGGAESATEPRRTDDCGVVATTTAGADHVHACGRAIGHRGAHRCVVCDADFAARRRGEAGS